MGEEGGGRAVLPAPIGTGGKEGFYKGRGTSCWGVEVWRFLWDIQVRRRVMWQVQSSREGPSYSLGDSAAGDLGQHLRVRAGTGEGRSEGDRVGRLGRQPREGSGGKGRGDYDYIGCQIL